MEKDPNKTYDENGVWDWRKDAGLKPEVICFQISFIKIAKK